MTLQNINTFTPQSVWTAQAAGTGAREYVADGTLTGAGYVNGSEIRLPAGVYEVEVHTGKPVTELNIRHRTPEGTMSMYTEKETNHVRGIVQDSGVAFVQAPLTSSEPVTVWLVARKIT